MKSFVAGVIVGIVIATVGVDGVASILNKGVNTVKTHSQELAE